MLEKPDIQDEKVIACLRDEYELPVAQFDFLPLGADHNTAVYQAAIEDDRTYFVKLRGGVFNEISVTLPKFLNDQGLKQIIAIYPTRTGKLWANLEAFKVLLYPFVVGQDGYEINLSDRHWRDFGAVLRRIHTLELPESLTRDLKQETYSPKWREMVKSFLARVENDSFDEPVAQRLAAFLEAKREETLDLVKRAEWHAQALQARSLEFVLCHADIHAGNILIDANDDLYIVDWDNPILAPKERDLMSIGGGLMGAGVHLKKRQLCSTRVMVPPRSNPARWLIIAMKGSSKILRSTARSCC